MGIFISFHPSLFCHLCPGVSRHSRTTKWPKIGEFLNWFKYSKKIMCQIYTCRHGHHSFSWFVSLLLIFNTLMSLVSFCFLSKQGSLWWILQVYPKTSSLQTERTSPSLLQGASFSTLSRNGIVHPLVLPQSSSVVSMCVTVVCYCSDSCRSLIFSARL